MATRQLPPQDYLLKLLRYDPETGVIRWRDREPRMFKPGNRTAEANCQGWNKRYAGQRAGLVKDDGHRCVSIGDGRLFGAHRVIWKMVTGEDPDIIDHINGRPDDNRWINLRSIPLEMNHRNVARRSDNTTGAAGIYHCAHLPKRPWRVRITVSGRHFHLGYHASFDEALAARNAAKKQHGFTERHGSG